MIFFGGGEIKSKLKRSISKNLKSLAIVLAMIATSTLVAISPAAAGTCTGAFPEDSSWKPVRSPNGGLLTDPLNDVSGSDNTNVDIYGTEATSTVPAGSAIDWYSMGTSGCFQFRMRIAQSAVDGSNIDNKQWSVGLGTGSTTKAWMVVNGNNSSPHQVWIYDGTPTLKFTYNFNGTGSNTSYAFATSVGSGASARYYVYWQVPYDDLISVLGASSSIYGFFAGTSQSNSFSAINRDCLSLSASCTAPSYTSTQSVDLSQNVSTSVQPPVISSLSDTKGSTSGSTSTVITGTNLTNTVRVLFDNTPATVVSSTSTSATVTTPAGTVGDANIQLETAAGGLSNTLQNAFKYITAPTVTTVAATGLTSTTAQFNGTVNPGNDATTTSFCYGTSNTVNGSGALQSCTSRASSSLSATTSTSSISYSQSLSSSTTYYFQAVAVNSIGTRYGSVLSFTTPAAPVALSITNSSPVTSGQVRVTYIYQFTATGGSGTYANWQVTSGSLPTGLSLNGTTGLLSGTPTALYSTANIEITVTDSAGASSSKTFSITISAGPPLASTLDATSVTQTGATLNGNVNDNGAATTVSWCMSTDAAVDSGTGALLSCTQISVSASPSSVSSGSGFTAVTGSVTSITASTTYYFQIKAVNSVSTIYGSIKSFTAINRTNQSALSLTLSPTSKTYPSYSQVMSMSTSGGSGTGNVTYQVTPGGSAIDCALSDSSASATLTSTSSGTCLIVATKAGDGTYNAISSSAATFTFNKANQTLSFATTSYSLAFGQSQTVSATGTGSGSVSYSIGSSTACTVSGSSVTVSAGTGTCTVTASIPADDFYNSANSSNSVTIIVSKASQTISFGSLSNRVLGSGTFTVSATGGASGNSVTFTSATETKCTVAGTTVTLVAAGTCTINANQLGNDNYESATQVPQSFTITEATPYTVSSVTASPSSGSATVGYGSAVSTTLTLTRAGDSGSNPTTTLSVTGGNWTVSGGSNVTTSSESLSSGSSVTLTLTASSGTITLSLNTGASAGTYTASTNSTTPLSYSVTVNSGAVAAS
jgi:hypothetical protein